MIVDLAIVADHVAPRGRRHRLMPRGAEIDDGEPQMAKGDARCGVGSRCRGNRAAPAMASAMAAARAFGPPRSAAWAGSETRYAAHQPASSAWDGAGGAGSGPDRHRRPRSEARDARGFDAGCRTRPRPWRGPPAPCAPAPRIGQGDDGLRQARGVARRHDMARHPVLDQFRNPTRPGWRSPACPRPSPPSARPARPRRRRAAPAHRPGERRGHAVLVEKAGKADILPMGRGHASRDGPVRAVAHQRQPQARHLFPRGVKGLHQHPHPLIGTSRPTKTRCRPSGVLSLARRSVPG
jgi:hypothetical protein